MRTVKLTVAYDGTRYAGWQVQAPSHQVTKSPGHRKATIQGTLERALRRILQEPVSVVGSGRTDTGVHALAQIAHMRTRSTIPCPRLLRSVNALLPPDIAVLAIDEAGNTFHARFNALRKQYRYRIYTGEVVPPFIRPYVHQVRGSLNLPLMRREAAVLKGTHDFRAFAKTTRSQHGTRRGISALTLARRGPELHLEVEGNGFLHTMVRSIAGTLIDVGRGHLPPGTIRRMLTTGSRRLAGTTAPARGLTLVRVEY